MEKVDRTKPIYHVLRSNTVNTLLLITDRLLIERHEKQQLTLTPHSFNCKLFIGHL